MISRNHLGAQKQQDKKRAYFIAPNSETTDQIAKMLAPDLRVVSASGKKVGQILARKKPKEVDSDSIVYKIPCSKCDKSYFGETGRGLRKRIQEHKNDLRNHRTSKALVIHADQEGHLPNWNEAQAIHTGLTKTRRWLIEAAYISTEKVINVSPGFFKLHDIIASQIKDMR